MMQGDALKLGFSVKNNAGSPVTPQDIVDLEITLGSLCKSYRRAELLYHEGRWLFPLSQGETFGLWPGTLNAQIRIHWLGGVVEGKPIYGLTLGESMSKEVL